MKATTTNPWMNARTSLFSTFAAFRPESDNSIELHSPEKTFRGTVVAIDADEHLLRVRGWWMAHKAFNLGDQCVYSEPGNEHATPDLMRPGEKVEVNYQDQHGVLIADRVEQIPMRLTGIVILLDTANRLLTLHRPGGLNTQLHLADDCHIALRDSQTGTLDDIKIGSHVTVTYETPDNRATAREIAQSSREFTGTLTAIDLDERTLKAKTIFGAKKFNVGGDCVVMIHGKPTGWLADLQPNAAYTFSYDEINGINVVNRIAPIASPWNNLPMGGPMPGF